MLWVRNYISSSGNEISFLSEIAYHAANANDYNYEVTLLPARDGGVIAVEYWEDGVWGVYY